LTKGAGIMASWGFSLDFVPHIAAGRVRWHRTDKTALLDLLISPKDLHQACSLFGAKRLATDFELMLPKAVADAKRDWTRGATYPGMLGIIKEIRELRTNYWPYENLTQMPLAFAFLSAKVGEREPAERALEKCITDFRLDQVEGAKLRDLLQSVTSP
jgi:hypothetical protein